MFDTKVAGADWAFIGGGKVSGGSINPNQTISTIPYANALTLDKQGISYVIYENYTAGATVLGNPMVKVFKSET